MKFPRNFPLTRLFQALFLSVCLTSVAAADETKIGTVDITKILDSYYKTVDAKKTDQARRIDIRKAEVQRLEVIKGIAEEMKKFEAEFSDPSLSNEKKKSIAQVAQGKNQELQNLQRELQEFRKRKGDQMTQATLETMAGLRKDVVEAVREFGEQADVDYIMDESGLTQIQVPFLLYVKDKQDFTDDIIAILNKNAPKQAAPKSE